MMRTKSGERTHAILHLTLLVVSVELEDVKDSLGVFCIVFASDGRFGEEFTPLVRHSLGVEVGQ